MFQTLLKMTTSLKDYSLPPELATTAQRELNETPSTRRDSLKEMRRKISEAGLDKSTVTAERVSEQIQGQSDDAFLLRFLRCKKFNVNRSFSVYEAYHRFRRDNTKLLADLQDPQSVRHIWEAGVIGGLKSRDKKGRSVMVSFPGRWDPSVHSLEDVLRALVFQLEHLVESEETQINGIVLIADFAGFSLGQAKSLKPWYFQMMTSLVQNAFPARFKGVYIVNQPWYISILLSLVRRFLSEKMNGRIKLIGSNLAALQEHFSLESLPQELGGSQPPYSGSEWAGTVLEAHERRVSTTSTHRAREGCKAPSPQPFLPQSQQTVV